MDINYESIIKDFTIFVQNWRVGKEGLPDELSGDSLVSFITDLQNKILNEISFQGEGNLVLYSGVPYIQVENMCKSSNGQFYMISQTEAGNILWDRDFREAIGNLINNDAIAERVMSGKLYIDANTYPPRINQYAMEDSKLLSLDDFISKKVTEAGSQKGQVLMIIGDEVSSDTVGLLTEFPELANNGLLDGVEGKGITVINKVPDIPPNNLSVLDKKDLSNLMLYYDHQNKVVGIDTNYFSQKPAIDLPDHIYNKTPKGLVQLNNKLDLMDSPTAKKSLLTVLDHADTKTINGIPVKQLRNLKNTLNLLDDSDIGTSLGKTIQSIPQHNNDPHAMLKAVSNEKWTYIKSER